MTTDHSSAPYALVVDDEPMILLNASDILENAGFRVVTAYNATEAIERLVAHEGDITLLFTDVEMPGSIGGFELARMTAQRWPDIGILVASGRIRPDDHDLPNGAIFVSKPFGADVIYERVHQLLPDGRKPQPLRNHQPKAGPTSSRH